MEPESATGIKGKDHRVGAGGFIVDEEQYSLLFPTPMLRIAPPKATVRQKCTWTRRKRLPPGSSFKFESIGFAYRLPLNEEAQAAFKSVFFMHYLFFVLFWDDKSCLFLSFTQLKKAWKDFTIRLIPQEKEKSENLTTAHKNMYAGQWVYQDVGMFRPVSNFYLKFIQEETESSICPYNLRLLVAKAQNTISSQPSQKKKFLVWGVGTQKKLSIFNFYYWKMTMESFLAFPDGAV